MRHGKKFVAGKLKQYLIKVDLHHSFKFEKKKNINNSKLCHSLTQIVLIVCFLEFPPVQISSVRSVYVWNFLFLFSWTVRMEVKAYKPDRQTLVTFNECCFIWNVIFECFLRILSSRLSHSSRCLFLSRSLFNCRKWINPFSR